MATFNSMAVTPTLFAYSQTLTIWPSAADLNVVLGISPTSIGVVWPSAADLDLVFALAPSSIGVVWPSETEPVVLSHTIITDPITAEAVRIVDGSGGVAYRMRAYDATLGREVFWSSQGIDDTGASYGGPGPLSDIVIHMLLGT